MKVTTDGCLFGAWASEKIASWEGKKNEREKKHILDIGTGTGLISLMLAQKLNASIDTIEIDDDAYQQAKENFSSSPWSDKLHAIHGNAKEFLFPRKYDVIVSNPPFYENELRSASIKKNKAHHEEGLLLDDLVTIIANNLQPDGYFFLLFPCKRSKEIEPALTSHSLALTHSMLVKQSTIHDHFRIMLSGTHAGNKQPYPITEELSIKNGPNYTSTFISLLKDYYLYL
jgi:tRNA1Val (adenine37-N6)-methyltransferase